MTWWSDREIEVRQRNRSQVEKWKPDGEIEVRRRNIVKWRNICQTEK